ncbi:uncharacterized protein LOC135215080 [Macrobrachium nipponense]|uniref:uncharacterized protein LOC135215080 n=1 Tax=Macrobrachium nipponense TaxID=159736 RepID=UPI0030C83F55
MRPFIVNKGKTPTIYAKHQDLEADSYSVRCSDMGWMMAELFHDWLGNIFEQELIKKNTTRPVILFLDGHTSHMNLETLRFAHEKGILMNYLPPHSSHIMQPLDVAVFKPLKTSYRKAYNEIWGELSGRDMAKKHFPHVLMKAIKECNIAENIKSGFRTTGLVPFNPNAVSPSRYVTAGEQPASPVQLQETSTITTSAAGAASPEEIYNSGFMEGQRLTLNRIEACVPQDQIAFFQTRKTPMGWINAPDLSYMMFRELQITVPCTVNPYAGQTQPVAVAKEMEPFPQAIPSTSGLQYQPRSSSSDISSPGPSGIATSTPPGVAERMSDTVRREILATPPEFFQESPWKAYFKFPQLTTKEKQKAPAIPKAANSEDYIRYLEIKERKKRLTEEKKEQRKKEREAKMLEKKEEAKEKVKARALPKSQG